jgi:hypothetical protein
VRGFYPVVDPEASSLIDMPQLTGTPERRLVLAVLERAILDYVGNDPQEVTTAESWLFDDVTNLTPEPYGDFSFPWVCQQLDLDMFQVAAVIKRMPRRGKHRVAPWYFARGEFLKEKEKVVRLA